MSDQVTINEFSSHGQGNGMDNVLLSENVLIGTIFFRPTDTLRERKFFNYDEGTAGGYQNLKLPVTSATAYDAKLVTASHNFQFETTTAYGSVLLSQTAVMEFEKATRIIVDQDKRSGILDVSLAELLPYTWVATSSTAGAPSYVQIAKAFPTYELKQTLQFGIAQKLSIRMVPPDGLTFPAYAVATTPILPGSGLPVSGSSPVDRGFSITLRFMAIEQARKV